MENILEFDPASEFQILETFEFEEEIQRPDELRLFTLEEQLLSYFEARMPKGKATRFQIQELSHEVDRIKDAYLDTVEPTDTLYQVKKRREVRMPEWVHPLFDDTDTVGYNYTNLWNPIFSEEQRAIPQFYTRMISALPRPYRTNTTENPPITESTIGQTDNGKQIRGLGVYERTRTVLHEDGTRDIVSTNVPNTQDDLRIKGYLLDPRQIEIPNPLADHLFLASPVGGKLLTTETFEDIYPSVDSILIHGVPTTTDPYTEGMKYLKVYDVKLSEIPWDAWKQRFPPVDPIPLFQPVRSLSFPRPADTSKPAESLQNVYALPWLPGINARKWLMGQEDAGMMVVRMLLSKASEAGTVPVQIVGEQLESKFPASTPEECLVTSSFAGFMESGISRFVNGEFKCVPATSVIHEKRDAISKGRIAWKESNEQDILKLHQTLLKLHQLSTTSEKVTKYQTISSREDSDLRREILVLLEDAHRTHEDKADAIDVLLKDIVPQNRVYLEANESFLICQHTLATLKGDMERDPVDFYREWSALETGIRVCRYCGEQIGNVYVAQDEFDNDGRLVVSHDKLDTDAFHGETHVDIFTNSLKELRAVFELENPGEAILYLMLSLLQVLPTDSQLLPILQFVRDISKALRAASKTRKIAADIQNRVEGVIGLSASVILLQSHVPFLIPRRSFGSRPLALTGYPRDTEDPAVKGALDTLIYVLRATFESFPSSFKGNVVPFFRAIISKPADIRKEAITYIQKASQKFKGQLGYAKERYIAPPENAVIHQVSLPLIYIEKTSYTKDETLVQKPTKTACAAIRPLIMLESKRQMQVSQSPVKYWNNIKPSSRAQHIPAVLQTDATLKTFSADDIRRRISLGFPNSLKLPTLKSFLDGSKDGITYLNLLQRLLDILSSESTFSQKVIQSFRESSVYIQTRITSSLLRDSAIGLNYELLKEVSSNADKVGLEKRIQESTRKDVVLRMILLDVKEADTIQQNLRAKERETMKQRLRKMNDTEREITKKLLDIGIAAYIITNEDRELFSREYQIPEEVDVLAQGIVDANLTEDGYNNTRDYVDDELPVGQNGVEMNVDNGDYGDNAVRKYDDYTNVPTYDRDGDYGV
jgi:hypothetical protein